MTEKRRMDKMFEKIAKSKITLPIVLIVIMIFTSELAGVFKAPVMLLLAILLYVIAYSQGKNEKKEE